MGKSLKELRLITIKSQSKRRGNQNQRKLNLKLKNKPTKKPLLNRTDNKKPLLLSQSPASTTCKSTISSNEELENYYSKENIKNFKEYGKNIFIKLQKSEDNFKISDNFLSKHKIESKKREIIIQIIWLLCKNFSYEKQVLLTATFLIDSYLNKIENKEISDDELKLLALTALNLSSKLEALVPYSLNHIITSWNDFKGISMEKVGDMEMEILNRLNFEFDFISTNKICDLLFRDLEINNSDEIQQFHLEDEIKMLNELSSYVSKLTLLNENFYQKKFSIIAYCCIYVSYTILCMDNKAISEYFKQFVFKWIEGLIFRQKNLDKTEIKEISQEIYSLYKHKNNSLIGKVYKCFYDF